MQSGEIMNLGVGDGMVTEHGLVVFSHNFSNGNPLHELAHQDAKALFEAIRVCNVQHEPTEANSEALNTVLLNTKRFIGHHVSDCQYL